MVLDTLYYSCSMTVAILLIQTPDEKKGYPNQHLWLFYLNQTDGIYRVFAFVPDSWTRGNSRRYMSTASSAATSNPSVSNVKSISKKERERERKEEFFFFSLLQILKRTDNSKRQIRPIQQRRLLLPADHVVAHVEQLETAGRSAHKRHGPECQPGELGRARRGSLRSQPGDEICRQRELDEALDVQEDFEPRPGRRSRGGEERVAGGGDVEAAQGDEEVEGRRGGLVEGFGVEGDEVESCKSWGKIV